MILAQKLPARLTDSRPNFTPIVSLTHGEREFCFVTKPLATILSMKSHTSMHCGPIFKKRNLMDDFLICNYHVKDFENILLFYMYKDILLYFHELKILYGCDVGDTMLFNKKDICIKVKLSSGRNG